MLSFKRKRRGCSITSTTCMLHSAVQMNWCYFCDPKLMYVLFLFLLASDELHLGLVALAFHSPKCKVVLVHSPTLFLLLLQLILNAGCLQAKVKWISECMWRQIWMSECVQKCAKVCKSVWLRARVKVCVTLHVLMCAWCNVSLLGYHKLPSTNFMDVPAVNRHQKCINTYEIVRI